MRRGWGRMGKDGRKKGGEGKTSEGEGRKWGERRRWENGNRGRKKTGEGRQGKTRVKKKEERSTYYKLIMLCPTLPSLSKLLNFPEPHFFTCKMKII